jgi:hypothetical protein
MCMLASAREFFGCGGGPRAPVGGGCKFAARVVCMYHSCYLDGSKEPLGWCGKATTMERYIHGRASPEHDVPPRHVF